MNGAVEKLGYLVLGGILSAAPVLLSTTMQARYATKQRMVEQRLTAIRDFSTACHRVPLVSRRFVMLYDMGQNLGPVSNDGKVVESMIRQFEAVVLNMENTTVSLAAQIAFANAVFGTDLKTPPAPAMPLPGPVTPADEKNIQDQLTELARAIPQFTDQCGSITKELMSKVND
jgi:hypothetical protein